MNVRQLKSISAEHSSATVGTSRIKTASSRSSLASVPTAGSSSQSKTDQRHYSYESMALRTCVLASAAIDFVFDRAL